MIDTAVPPIKGGFIYAINKNLKYIIHSAKKSNSPMTILTSSTADACFVENGKPIIHGLERMEHMAEHFSKIASATRPGYHICPEQAEAFFYHIAHKHEPEKVDIDTKKGKKWALRQFYRFVRHPEVAKECLH